MLKLLKSPFVVSRRRHVIPILATLREFLLSGEAENSLAVPSALIHEEQSLIAGRECHIGDAPSVASAAKQDEGSLHQRCSIIAIVSRTMSSGVRLRNCS